MQKKYQTLAENGEATIKSCLKVITDEISKHGGVIFFGNARLIVKDGTPMLSTNGGEFVELYGEDGYETLEDIAHWADIVEDYSACKAAGNKLYSVTWNL